MNYESRVWHLGSELRALRPDAMAWLDMANERAWSTIQPSLLEQIRLRVGTLIGNKGGLARRSSAACAQGLVEAKIAQLSTYYESPEFSALEKRCLSFAEQFVIDVTRLTAADLSDLGRYFSAEQVHDFVVALYVTECTQRLEMMGPVLLGGIADSSGVAPPFNVDAHEGPGGIESALDRYQEAVVRGTALDPVTAEMVRLRCARTHNCRICRTLRLVNAREAGVDDAMTAKIDFYEKSDLDEPIKLALRITDAFITRPDTLAEATVAQAGAAFTRHALAELCLDITKWSTQKIHVALGTDGSDILPKNAQGMSFFTFDADGRVAGFTAAPRGLARDARGSSECPGSSGASSNS